MIVCCASTENSPVMDHVIAIVPWLTWCLCSAGRAADSDEPDDGTRVDLLYSETSVESVADELFQMLLRPEKRSSSAPGLFSS